MSRFLLDTNIPSEVTKPRAEPRLLRWLGSVTEDDVFISVVTVGEIRKGCDLLSPGKRRSALDRWLKNDLRAWFDGRILPMDEAIAERWGELDAKRQRLGRPLNTADGQIAATALEYGLTVVTRNTHDFESLGVEILDPWQYRTS